MIEALRAYAASHDGRLPERLDQITATPIPDNVMAGKPFAYRLEDGVALLKAGPLDVDARRYRIRIAKKK